MLLRKATIGCSARAASERRLSLGGPAGSCIEATWKAGTSPRLLAAAIHEKS